MGIRWCYFFFAALLALVFLEAFTAALFLVALVVALVVALAVVLAVALAVLLPDFPVVFFLPLPVVSLRCTALDRFTSAPSARLIFWLSTASTVLTGADASAIPLALRYKLIDIQ